MLGIINHQENANQSQSELFPHLISVMTRRLETGSPCSLSLEMQTMANIVNMFETCMKNMEKQYETPPKTQKSNRCGNPTLQHMSKGSEAIIWKWYLHLSAPLCIFSWFVFIAKITTRVHTMNKLNLCIFFFVVCAMHGCMCTCVPVFSREFDICSLIWSLYTLLFEAGSLIELGDHSLSETGSLVSHGVCLSLLTIPWTNV